jgi:hypothetical protein
MVCRGGGMTFDQGRAAPDFPVQQRQGAWNDRKTALPATPSPSPLCIDSRSETFHDDGSRAHRCGHMLETSRYDG